VKGNVVKFDNGGFWRLSLSQTPLPDATYAAVDTILVYLKWENGKATYVTPDERGILPERDTLGDTDEALWPKGKFSPDPEDPWKINRVVYLLNTTTAGMLTFVSPTAGAHAATRELVEQVDRMRQFRPGAIPIVRLSSMEMSTQYGPRKRPHFEVVDWRGGTVADAPRIEPPTLREEMNDEMPI